MSNQSESLSPSDHRHIGRRLGLFRIDPETGRGLPIWLPNGTIVRDELEKLARELEFRAGFRRVATPHIARVDLYYRSGHLPYFRDDMYPRMDVLEESEDRGADDESRAAIKDSYVLRPMNCPHHHRVFAAEPRSFRDLPLRLAEYGQVYRWERSGALSGLARVRGMCMNDGHIYCTPEQVEAELSAVLDMYSTAYALLGIERYSLRLSRRDPADPKAKYVDDDSGWRFAESLLARLLDQRGLSYRDGPGHAAFYGPKIDFQVSTAAGIEETLSTVQLDFAQPARMGLEYIASSGEAATPLCIHRAPFSTHERFVAFLSEHYDGAFPTWLAPTQLLVVPVSDRFDEYARRIVDRLRRSFVRAERANASATVSKNIRDAIARRVPNVAIVGERELEQDSVTLRRHGVSAQATLGLDALERVLLEAIARRARKLDV